MLTSGEKHAMPGDHIADDQTSKDAVVETGWKNMSFTSLLSSSERRMCSTWEKTSSVKVQWHSTSSTSRGEWGTTAHNDNLCQPTQAEFAARQWWWKGRKVHHLPWASQNLPNTLHKNLWVVISMRSCWEHQKNLKYHASGVSKSFSIHHSDIENQV